MQPISRQNRAGWRNTVQASRGFHFSLFLYVVEFANDDNSSKCMWEPFLDIKMLYIPFCDKTSQSRNEAVTSWTPVTFSVTIIVQSQRATGECWRSASGTEPLHISLAWSDSPKQIRTALRNILEWENKTWLLKIEIPQRQIRQWKLQTEENFEYVQTRWKNEDTQSWRLREDMAVPPKWFKKHDEFYQLHGKRQIVKK